MKKIIVNKEIISKLNPCKDRFDNYIKFYGDKTFTEEQFMGLKNITQEDKIWLAFRLMPKENIRLAAIDVAESVLYIFEQKYPNDPRPRQAIEAARNIKNRGASAYSGYVASAYAGYVAASAYAGYVAAAVYAAVAAVGYVIYTIYAGRADSNASNAAYAAGHAAVSAANIAAYASNTSNVSNAAYAAAYTSNAIYVASNADYAAYAAGHAAVYAANAAKDRKIQEKLIRKIILKYWNN